MKTIWNENPFLSETILDDSDKHNLYQAYKIEQYESILGYIDYLFKKEKLTKDETQRHLDRYNKIYFLEKEDEIFADFEKSLKETHFGDCVSYACSCSKCYVESFLGIDTIEGLDKSAAHSLFSAFSEGNNFDKAVEYLKTAYTYETRHKAWEKYSREAYEKHIPTWEQSKQRALQWLLRYKQEKLNG